VRGSGMSLMIIKKTSHFPSPNILNTIHLELSFKTEKEGENNLYVLGIFLKKN
jgi:hypothetical protein